MHIAFLKVLTPFLIFAEMITCEKFTSVTGDHFYLTKIVKTQLRSHILPHFGGSHLSHLFTKIYML